MGQLSILTHRYRRRTPFGISYPCTHTRPAATHLEACPPVSLPSSISGAKNPVACPMQIRCHLLRQAEDTAAGCPQ